MDPLIDPCVFVDDDGQAYIYNGGGGICKGGKLKDNMVELDGEMKDMEGLEDFHEATWIHKYNGKYYVSGNAILKQTVDPDPGYAVQEVFFTSKGDNIYAILPKYLKSIVLKDIYSTSQTKISLLGCDKEVEWKQEKDNIRITMPFLSFEELSCNYAWTLKLEKVK